MELGVPHRFHWALIAPLLAALTLAATALPAIADPGDLDSSFGKRGRVATATSLGGPSWLDADVRIARGPAGTIVAAVGNSVLRYLPDGRLDRSFGEGGKLTVTEVEGLPFSLSDVAVDQRSKIILFGEVQIPGIRLPASYIGATIPFSQAAVVRYEGAGVLDPTFGGGDGSIVTDFDQPPYYEGPRLEGPMSVIDGKAVAGVVRGTVDADGGLTLLGSTTEIIGCFRGTAQRVQRLIARLTPAGVFDPSFGGGDGIASETGFAGIAGFSATGNGGEMLVGRLNASDPCKEARPEAVGRLLPNGGPDPSFSSDGFRPLSFVGPVSAIAVDSLDRTLVVLGSTVVRLTSRGKLDRRFGRQGAAFLKLPGSSELASVIVPHSGRVLLAGTQAVSKRKSDIGRTYLYRHSFTVIRLNSLGRSDRGFGSGGWLATRFGKQSSAVASDAFVDAAGRLVVGGAVARSDLEPTGGIALARYFLGG
ncbi:MAG: hypothetical protein ABW196_11640 [Solirubrobacterales bacterium]